MSKKKGTNFLVQGSILAMASIISRIIGLVYRIPMNSIIGDVGNGYYGTAFDIYNILLIISSYSLPLAVSKLVSARIALGEKRKAYQILKGAMLFALVTGTIAALIVYFGAEFLTGQVLKTPYSVFALRILGPALVVVAVLGVLRGFFQGMGTMIPSAVSQVLEQIVNAVVSVWAAYVLYRHGARIGAVLGNEDQCAAAYGAAGGTLGTNLGSVAALLFMIFVYATYIRRFKRRMRKERSRSKESFSYTMSLLIITIIPVLLSTTIYNISGIIDQGIFKNVALLQGYTEDKIDVWWGVFSGKYKLMINVPISIASALAASSVPALTASYAEGDMEGVRKEINAAMRFIMIVAFPSTVGLSVLATPIFSLLFPGTISTTPMAAMMMLTGSTAVIFYSISTLSNGLLQGINQMRIPVINAAVALVVHVLFLLILMLVFRLNIHAVVLASCFFGLLMCLLNGRALAKHSGYKQEWYKTFLVPMIGSAVMGAAAFFTYKGLHALSGNNVISLLPALIVAVFVYGVALLLLKGMTEEELLRFPKGAVILRLARKLHLI